MTGNSAIEYLKGLCDRIDEQTKATIRKTIVVAAVPIAAGFSVACYGMPMEDQPDWEDTTESCSDGVDNDDNGLTDCEETACLELEVCVEQCDDDLDNDADGLTDCDDSDCDEDAACI